jgi:hypothetical protein
MPTLVTPHIAVPTAVSTLRFSALPAEPIKGVAIAWQAAKHDASAGALSDAA